MGEIAKTGAHMQSCKIARLNMRVGEFEPGDEIRIGFESKYRRLDVDGIPSGLEAELRIHGNEGKALDIETVIRATFAFDGSPSFDDAEMFLAKEAPSRIMDVVRVYVEELTTMTAFPTLSIPPLSPTVDPREWHKED